MSSDTPGWRVQAASVQGVSHAKVNMPCQDAHAFACLPDGILIAAVADGAGSAPLADVGAQAAVRAVVEAWPNPPGPPSLSVRTSLGKGGESIFEPPPFPARNERIREGGPGGLGRLLVVALHALRTEAETLGVPIRDLATTLIVVVAMPHAVYAAQVGDGAVVIRERDGTLRALTTPPDSEYANATTFLLDETAIDSAQYCVWEGGAAQIALFSDGLQRLALKMPEGLPHVPFFTPLFQFAQAADSETGSAQMAAFLNSPRVRERADDDLTLLLATRDTPPAGGESEE